MSRRGARGRDAAARPSRRELAGIVIVASTAVLVAVSVIAAGLNARALWVFEVLAGVGVLVGLGVAFGAFDPPSAGPRGLGPRRAREPQVAAAFSASVEAQLRRLDPVEHRRLDLGSPWPTVVVGPTGVTVVAAVDRAGAAASARVREVSRQIRLLTVTRSDERPIAVRSVLVVPDGQAVPIPGGEVLTVPVSDLAGLLARGPIVPMATVTALFTRLSGRLAPDLQADAV